MSRSLCKYKNALGIPQKGFHAQRVKIGTKDFALYDILGTFVLALLFNKLFFPRTNYFYCLAITFFLGEFMHWVFCVDTSLLKLFKVMHDTGAKETGITK